MEQEFLDVIIFKLIIIPSNQAISLKMRNVSLLASGPLAFLRMDARVKKWTYENRFWQDGRRCNGDKAGEEEDGRPNEARRRN